MVIPIALPCAVFKVVAQRIDLLRFCPAAIGADIGLFARRCAGGRFGFSALVPTMRCLGVGHIAAGALLPVVIPVALPCAVFKVVAKGGDRLRFRIVALRAGKSLYAIFRAGGRFGFSALVPLMVAFIRVDLAAGILFPVLVFIPLPAAQRAAVVVGIKGAVGCAAGLADGLGLAGRRAAGVLRLGVGHIAAGALLPVVIPIALPCAAFKVVAQRCALHGLADGTGLGFGAGGVSPRVLFQLTVRLTAGLADGLGLAGRRAAGVLSIAGFSRVLCHRTVCVFAIVPMVSVVMHPSVGPAVPRGTDGLSSRRGADGAGIGLFARRCAGGRFGFSALVPLMIAFIRADLAAGILFPVVVFIGLPVAQRAGVAGGICFAAFKGVRALGPADAGPVVESRRYTGRIESLIAPLRHFLVIGVRNRIVFALADRAHMPVLVGVSCPFAGPVVLARDELGGAAADRADGNSAVVFVPEFLGLGIARVS